MLDKKWNFALCTSKINEEVMCEFQFTCSLYIHLFINLSNTGLALLRSERWKVIIPLPERYDIQSSGTYLRLVVQRKMRIHNTAVRAQRTTLQIHITGSTQVPGRFQRARGR